MPSVDVEGVICPFCGSGDPRIRYRFDDCAIVRCQACELMWLHPKPSSEQVHQVYDDDYYSNKEFFRKDGAKLYGYVDYLSERINKQYDYLKIAEEMSRRLRERDGPVEPRRHGWLDVGCGLGFLMDVAFDQGFRVHGVEFNRAAIRYIQSKFTFPVEYGLVNEIDLEESFDVISLFDVIEHMEDPFDSLIRIRKWARPGAYCLIQTMDSDSFVSRLIGKNLEDFRRTREHLFFFTRRSVTRALDRAGWEVVDIRSMGHTFQLAFLIDRLAVFSPRISRLIRAMVYPRWLLAANFYINPGTKMIVYARLKDTA